MVARLTDALARSILDPSAGLTLTIDHLIDWEPLGFQGSGLGVHTSIPILSEIREPLALRIRIMSSTPWSSHYLLIWGTRLTGCVNLRRLDLRDDHRNPDGAEVWTARTHKHTWSESHADCMAYTPTDIPHDPDLTVGVDEYRQVFEAFCAECYVALGPSYRWTEPSLPGRGGGESLWVDP